MLSRTCRFILQIEFQVDNNGILTGAYGGDREQRLPNNARSNSARLLTA